jgi:hypothetical protein
LTALAALTLLLALLPTARAVWSAPILTLLRDQTPDGSKGFTDVLVRLWDSRTQPTPDRLAVRVVIGARQRLSVLARGRGDFAIVTAEEAAALLPEYKRLAAVAVLWPLDLIALTRNRQVNSVALPLRSEVWVLQGGDYAFHLLSELTRDKPEQQALLSLLPAEILPDALAYADGPVLLASLPRVLPELSAALAGRSGLKVLPYGSSLLEELQLHYAWLTTDTLERGALPGLSKAQDVPALYLVMVGRRALPEGAIRKMLTTVYDRTTAATPFDPLFALINSRMNAVLSKLLPFHPVTAQVFNFPPSVP